MCPLKAVSTGLLLVLAMLRCGEISGSNGLTSEDIEQGWVLLFDGKTTKGWHTYNRPGIVDPRWSVQDGELVLAPAPSGVISGADLETEQSFSDFELSLEWKISAGGNSGIMYRVEGKGRSHPWEAGPEYQLIDNKAAEDPPIHQAGSVWDLYAPARDVTRQVGEFNKTRIIVKDNLVEHWLNEVRILSYQLGSQDFEERRAKSVYREFSTFGSLREGTIVLQDEGRLMRFRNVRIRPLR